MMKPPAPSPRQHDPITSPESGPARSIAPKPPSSTVASSALNFAIKRCRPEACAIYTTLTLSFALLRAYRNFAGGDEKNTASK